MARKPTIDPTTIPPHSPPALGGSYHKDPVTGALTRIDPQPEAAAVEAPTVPGEEPSK